MYPAELTPVEQREYEKNAPDRPLEFEVFDHASRAMTNLRMMMGAVKSLLKAYREGGAVEIHGCSLPIGRLERSRLFGQVWDSCLKQLTYWEFHCRRYIAIPKHTKRDLEALRKEIQCYIDGDG